MTLDKLDVGINGLRPALRRYVEGKWSPGVLQNERAYKKSLSAFLREIAPDAHIEEEYRCFGTTIDIYLKWSGLIFSGEIYVELKYNLKQKTEYDRLVGQIEQLDPKNRSVLLILCGSLTSENFLARLRERYRDVIDSPLPGPQGLTVVTKSQANAATS